MSQVDWKKILGWKDDELEDLRVTGFAYVRQGKYEIAATFFEALNVLDEKNAYDAQTLGAIYLELNQPSRALYFLDKALKLDADHALTLLNLSKVFLMLGKKEEAMRLCGILKQDPDPEISRVARALLIAYS